MKKLVGKVTEKEMVTIKNLYERRNGLYELGKILTPNNTELYEKLVKDLGETTTNFDNWWNSMSTKYEWESIEGGQWTIDFETCEIFLDK